MQTVTYLDNLIANQLLVEQQDSKRKADLENTLSASILGYPLQYQILHIIGVPKKDMDTYTLRKFQRGHEVEARIKYYLRNDGLLDKDAILELSKTKKAILDVDEENQAVIEYKGVTGHIDALVDHTKWEDFEHSHIGIVPHEVKSITNADYNRNFGPKAYHRPEAKRSHKLQAGLYALALEAPYFFVDYVASDDYRLKEFLYETEEVADEIHTIIDEVYDQLAIGKVPVFVPRETWQANKDYQGYPTWSDLGEDEMEERLKTEYPDAYKRLKSFAQ